MVDVDDLDEVNQLYRCIYEMRGGGISDLVNLARNRATNVGQGSSSSTSDEKNVTKKKERTDLDTI